MLSPSDLHEYQNDAVRFGMDTRRCALFLGLGMGKTIISLTLLAIEHTFGHSRRTLIVAPLRVANTVWHVEAARWEHTEHLSFAIATGSVKRRLQALNAGADVTVINVENLAWLVRTFPRSKWVWDTVILDESSGYKEQGTQRFKAAKAAMVDKPKMNRARQVIGVKLSFVRRIVLLSATPATNGLRGLWAQLYLIDAGKRLGRSYTSYETEHYYLPARAQRYTKPILLPDADKRIAKKVEDVCYVLKAEDHLDMPSLTVNTIELPIPDSLREQYRILEREFLLTLPTGEEVLAPNAGALCNKLLQFCNGAIYTGEAPARRIPDRDCAILHDAKLDALSELVANAEGNENLLVAYYYQSDLKRLMKRFPQAVAMSKSGVEVIAWNEGRIPILFAQPLSAGMGLNLQHGGSTCIFYSLLWHLEAYLQFIGRLNRQGQTRGVTVNHLTIERTIEQRVLVALQSQATTQENFLDLVLPSVRY